MAKPERELSAHRALLAYLSEGHHRRRDGEPFRWGGRAWCAEEVAHWLGELEARSEAQYLALARAMRPRSIRPSKISVASRLGVGTNTLHRLVDRGLAEMAMGMGLR